MKNLIITLATIFTVALLIWAIGHSLPKIISIYKDKPKTEIKVDTVITEKRDTIILTNIKPYTEIKYKKVVDTLKTTDSVFVPVEVPISLQKYEGDTLSTDGTKVHYRASISGYRQSLDTLWLDVAHNDRTITKEVVKWKKKRGFKIAPNASFGYGLFNKKPDMYVGIGISYNF